MMSFMQKAIFRGGIYGLFAIGENSVYLLRDHVVMWHHFFTGSCLKRQLFFYENTYCLKTSFL